MQKYCSLTSPLSTGYEWYREERKQRFQTDLDTDREKDAANYTTCLGCRKRGHFLKDCPQVSSVAPSVDVKEVCFNCGSQAHILRDCPEKSNGRKTKLAFATCFIWYCFLLLLLFFCFWQTSYHQNSYLTHFRHLIAKTLATFQEIARKTEMVCILTEAVAIYACRRHI